jgi:hypothetical protein
MPVAMRPNNVVLNLPYFATVDKKATTNFLQIKKVLDNLFFNNITFTGNLVITGSLLITGDLDVGGNTTLGGTLHISGTTTVSGPTTFTSTVGFTNIVTFSNQVIFNSGPVSIDPTTDPGTSILSIINTWPETTLALGSTGPNPFIVCNSVFTVLFSGQIQTSSTNESTGAGAALLGANSPAITLTAPYRWLSFTTSDNSQVYIPAWK